MKPNALTVVLAALFFACGGPSGDTPNASSLPSRTETVLARADEREPVAETAAGAGCAALSRTACLQSISCTLEAKVPGERTAEYVCRESEGACEEGFAQFGLPGGGAKLTSQAAADAAIALCTDRPGCTYRASDRYCRGNGYGRTAAEDGSEAEMCNCFCGGGAPPACVDTTSS